MIEKDGNFVNKSMVYGRPPRADPARRNPTRKQCRFSPQVGPAGTKSTGPTSSTRSQGIHFFACKPYSGSSIASISSGYVLFPPCIFLEPILHGADRHTIEKPTFTGSLLVALEYEYQVHSVVASQLAS